MNNFEESSDEGAVKRRTDRCIELCAMFKEVKNGSYKTLLTILAKFGLQEGVSDRKVKEYFKLLRTSGLITITNGHKSWRYNSEAEWDLFRVNI